MSEVLNLKQMVPEWPSMPVEIVERFLSLFSLDEEGVTVFSNNRYTEARLENGEVTLQIGKVSEQDGEYFSSPSDILHVLRGRWDAHENRLYDETVLNFGKNEGSIFDLSADLQKIIRAEQVFVR